ncbi:protease complex subunit PrcB family protein [Bacillus shivajii]|uniref:protease complex subunit PrcB family protein n=1 Tax=Bacillus shivajii TaxID=1983719 RepID=UPI001CF9EF82|nr:protease complex subunit PrcB family protein [Bacillus shivajii]UCZ55393.1 protease complex subunit PrcB family protein [Bacillus shivajii]
MRNLTYTELTISEAQEISGVKEYINKLRTGADIRGWKTFFRNGDVVVVISAGQRRTGGYSLSVEDVIGNGEVHIYIREHEPSPDQFVTQVLTNPFIVLEIQNVKVNKKWKVIDVNKSEYFPMLRNN